MKEKLWQNRHLILLLLILVFAFFVRFDYLTEYSDQGLWYDEGEYLLRAESIAFDDLEDPEGVAERRPVLMPAIWGSILFLGGGEYSIKFFQVLISVLTILFVYLLGKEAHSKNLGLIMAALLAISWIHIFFSIRIVLDEAALLFSVMAMYFFVRCCKNSNWKDSVLAGVFTALAVMSFYIPLYLIPLFLVYLFFTKKFDMFKDKNFWYGVLAFVLALAPWLLWSYIVHGDPLFGLIQYHGTGQIEEGYDFGILGFFKVFPAVALTGMMIFFLIGLIKSLIDVGLSLDLIWNRKTKKLDFDVLFLGWLLIVPIALGIEIVHVEQRYMFPAFIALFYFLGKGLLWLKDVIDKNLAEKSKEAKYLSVILIILLLAYFAFAQLSYAEAAIGGSSSSFQQQREAGDWLSENMELEDNFVACSYVVVYQAYAERQGYAFGMDVSLMDEVIEKYDPKYLVADAFTSDCAFEEIVSRGDQFVQKAIFYYDEAETQPIVVIYEVV